MKIGLGLGYPEANGRAASPLRSARCVDRGFNNHSAPGGMLQSQSRSPRTAQQQSGDFPDIVGIPLLPIADGVSRAELAEWMDSGPLISYRGRSGDGDAHHLPAKSGGRRDWSSKAGMAPTVTSYDEIPGVWVIGTVEAVQEERRRRAAGLPPLHPQPPRPRPPSPPAAVTEEFCFKTPRCVGRWKPPGVSGPAALEAAAGAVAVAATGTVAAASGRLTRPASVSTGAHGLGPAWRRRLVSVAD